MKISFHGVKFDQNTEYFSKNFLEKKLTLLNQTINDDSYGFFHLTKKTELIDSCKKVFNKFSDRTHFFQIGIGGSSLGPEMLISALSKKPEVKFQFINNIDPEKMHDQLANLDPQKSLFYFVSKSGGTAETNAALAIITTLLQEKGIKESDFKNYFVFCTDPVKSDLLNLGNELGIDCLQVPSNVGGRFSVLTPVGILPALFAGINVDQLWQGAESVKSRLLESNVEKNELLKLASIIMQLKDKAVSQTVFMPYSSKLRDFSFWFIQLWAESLGKKLSRDGKIINTGLTPIPGYGATDQHSQVQLFMEGPHDKLFFMLEIENFSKDYSLSNAFTAPSLKKLSGHSLSQLMKAEFEGTLKAMEQNERPYIRFSLTQNNEMEMGEAILFFESLTALMGHYLNIDPFDQPGVEAGKIFAFEFLERH